MTMAPERLSRLQRRILAWLWAEEQRTRGTMAASHYELVQALAKMARTSFTSVGSEADSPAPLLRPSPAMDHDPEKFEV
jgi:hypothetical protein